MYAFAFLLICVQACLIQNVYGQYYGGAPAAAPCAPSYGGCGVGDVNVCGELPVCGDTQLCGQVPILGAVEFKGCIPACGEVSICGRCEGCGCRGGY